ncbi:MAG: RHS repeat domain-containing protein, partial [Bacteroidota bacterium]
IIGVSNDQLSSITGIGPNYHSGTAGLASSKRQLIESAYPSALVSSYTFIRGLGIDTMTDPNGLTSSYTYDNQGRLLEVRDHENNLINSYEYNYANSNE